MTEFTLTPTNIEFIADIYRNPLTNRWVLPTLTFQQPSQYYTEGIGYRSGYYTEGIGYRSGYYPRADPLNDDPRYRKHVVDHIYTRLSEKWLFKHPIYNSLLKYFTVERNGEEIKVKPVSNIEQAKSSNVSKADRRYVLRYIDRVFVTHKFVRRVLKEYVGTTHIKWYDLYHNTNTLKDLFAHKLKKLIISTIYDLES